jgi:hypothetical protein
VLLRQGVSDQSPQGASPVSEGAVSV